MVTRVGLTAVILLRRWLRWGFELFSFRTTGASSQGAGTREKCAVDAAVRRKQPAPGAKTKVPTGVGRVSRGGADGRTLVGGRGGKQKKETDASHQIHPQRVEADVRMSGDNPLKRGSLRLMVVDSVNACMFVRVANSFGNLFCWWRTNVSISMCGIYVNTFLGDDDRAHERVGGATGGEGGVGVDAGGASSVGFPKETRGLSGGWWR